MNRLTGLLDPMRNDDQPREESNFIYDVAPDESLSEGVIAAISAVSGSDPTPETPPDSETGRALEPLYTAINPEALDSVFRTTDSETARTGGRVTFSYHGYEIAVHSEGRVVIQRFEAAGEADD